jgi:hypothetical protein
MHQISNSQLFIFDIAPLFSKVVMVCSDKAIPGVVDFGAFVRNGKQTSTPCSALNLANDDTSLVMPLVTPTGLVTMKVDKTQKKPLASGFFCVHICIVLATLYRF